jgi:hypothetical protein
MSVKDQMRKQRHRHIQRVGMYAVRHPELSFRHIGGVFGVNPQWASRAARAVGQPPRRRGRKKQQVVTVTAGGNCGIK